MERTLIIVAWVLVVATAGLLRLDELAKRPFHADEATGARITAARMSGEGGKFDPKHYHGPLLGDVAALVCRMRGEDDWKRMRKETLRWVTVAAGLGCVLLPLCWRRRLGDLTVLMMAGILAVSPLLVYYSRMFIHEMWLVLAGGAFLACFAGQKPRPIPAGVALGLMFAVKETFVISMLAWVGALIATLIWSGQWRSATDAANWLRANLKIMAWMAGVGCLVSLLFYTRGFTYPVGAWHAVKTFFVYETVEGHDKPWWWYLRWLGWPEKRAGMWWLECVILWLGLGVWLVSLLPRMGDKAGCSWLRFLGFSLIGHLVIYGFFSYKTPWLMCLPWWHACLLAGSVVLFLPQSRWLVMVSFLMGFCLVAGMSRQARMACGRLESDARNPYAYVPTRPDVERMETFLGQLSQLGGEDSVAVVGSDYWPLPWYLRSFTKSGYWSDSQPRLVEMPFVLVMPERETGVKDSLGATHTALPYGLRPDVTMALHVRNDIWKRWMETKP